jgi:S1-C subfamily serine protease
MHISSRSIALLALIGALSVNIQISFADDLNTVPVSAPIDTDSTGRAGDIATHSVIRLICVDQNTVGTGFLHKSGNIITADHVTRDCKNVVMILPDGTRGSVTTIAADQDHDLALAKPSIAISAAPLSLAAGHDFRVGAQVSTWGFPGGYSGLLPMLSVGYLAGIDAYQIRPGTVVRKWIVNAAFNGGNSGGPLIKIETGEVFGVVSSKLAPISPTAASILKALENNNSGLQYTATAADGSTKSFSEGQLVGMVLDELRRQVQLVIGQAVLLDDLTGFLKANKIDP